MNEPTNKFLTSGKIIAIDDVQTFASGFSKRAFIIEVPDGKYSEHIKFEMHKERADVLESFIVNDTVSVTANVKGNEYNGKYYVNLVAWKVELDQKSEQPPKHSLTPATEQGAVGNDDGDDIPF